MERIDSDLVERNQTFWGKIASRPVERIHPDGGGRGGRVEGPLDRTVGQRYAVQASLRTQTEGSGLGKRGGGEEKLFLYAGLE